MEALVETNGFGYCVYVGFAMVGQGQSEEMCQNLADELNSDPVKLGYVVNMQNGA